MVRVNFPRAIKVVERGRTRIENVELNYIVLDEDPIGKYKCYIIYRFWIELDDLINLLYEFKDELFEFIKRKFPINVIAHDSMMKIDDLVNELEDLPIELESLLDKHSDEDVVIEKIENELLKIIDEVWEIHDEIKQHVRNIPNLTKLVKDIEDKVDEIVHLLKKGLYEIILQLMTCKEGEIDKDELPEPQELEKEGDKDEKP